MKMVSDTVANNLPPAGADAFLRVLKKSGYNKNTLPEMPVFPGMPLKYYNRMQCVWREMFLRVLFERTSKKLSYAERFKLAQKVK